MITPWKTIASRMALSDRWIRIRADTCERADGTRIAPFYVSENSEWICILPLTPEGDVVTVTEYRHGAGRVITGFPGGAVEPGDASPETAAARELAEETGYVCGTIIPLGAAYANAANQTQKVHYFLGLDARRERAPTLDPTEEIEVTHRPWDDVRALGFLQQSFHLACLHLATAYLADHPDVAMRGDQST